MSKADTVLSIISILGFISVFLADGPIVLALLFFAIAASAIVTALTTGYRQVLKIKSAETSSAHYLIQWHILLHIIPASYLLLQIFTETTVLFNVIYYPFLLLFFFTGRKSWEALHKKFGSVMYMLFFKGNTAMLVTLSVLIVLGLLYKDTLGSEVFASVLTAYSTIHFLLTGIAVLKIKKDVSNEKSMENLHKKI